MNDIADIRPITEIPAPLGGQRAVVEGVHRLAVRGEAGVLAVVVATAGSTYRKPGAMILLDARGVAVGALSGGCLEGDLEAAARDMLARGAAGEARFDTSGDEDRVFGSGTGCGGSTHVLLLPLPADASPLREALCDAEARGLELRLRLATAAATLGAGEAVVGRSRIDTRRYRFARDGRAADTSPSDAVIETTTRRSLRVLLLGAGPETRPLLRLARGIGWHVELAEHRQRWLRYAEGCGIDAVHDEGPGALPALLEASRFDAALVMNHNYLLDARALTALADTRIAHVGLLGPAARRDELLAEIGGSVAARLRSRLHAPVGLPLGGEGAEAIALAIVAQLQNQFSRGVGDD